MLLFPLSPVARKPLHAVLAPSLLLKLLTSSICQAVSQLLEPWKSFCWLQKSTQLLHSVFDLSHERKFQCPFLSHYNIAVFLMFNFL